MSTGGPNLRVGLEVNIFGTKQMAKAQAALSALGLSIQDVEDTLVNVNGVQTRYYKGLIQLTAKTEKAKIAQQQAATAAIKKATANAKAAASVTKTTAAAKQATAELKKLKKQQEAVAKAAQQLAQHQAKLNATLNTRTAIQNNLAANQQANILLRTQGSAQIQNQRAANDAARQAHQLRMADIRRENSIQLQNLRHQQALQRQQERDSFAPMTAIGSVGRVIAYDMLRRTITNLYQGFWRIQETLGQWVVESVNFNDEIDRAKTVFQGIGMIGTKNASGGNMTIPEAEISTDPKVRSVLAQSQANADSMIRGLMEISAMTGSDMDEVISSARQLLPDLINKRAKAGMPNPYLEKPEEFNAITQQMVKLASVLKMSDPGGRPLKWHMVAIQEMFSGTSGGGKDKGMEAVRSLRAREGVRVDEKQASELAKAVNAGDLMKASTMITDILERAGQGIQNLDNLMAKTLKPNVDGVVTALRIFGMDFTDLFHKDLINVFTTIRVGLFKILNLESYKKTMADIGQLFADQFGDIRATIFKYLQMIYDDPRVIFTTLEGPIKNLGAGFKAMRSALEGVALFVAGFLGTDLAFGSMTKAAETFKLSAYDTGVETAKTTAGLITLISELANFAGEINLILAPIRLINMGFATLFEIINIGLTRFIENHSLPRMLGIGKNLGEGGLFGDFGKLIKEYLYDRTGYIDYTRTPRVDQAGQIVQASGGTQPGAPLAASAQPRTFASMMAYQNQPVYMNPGPLPAAALYNRGPLGLPQFPDRSPQKPVGPTFDREAVIAGIKGMKPINFQPKSVGVNLTFQVGEMKVTTNDAKQFATDLASGALNMTNKPLTGRNAPSRENNPWAGFSAGLGLNIGN